MVGSIDSPVQMIIRLLLGYSLAWSDDAIFMTAVVLVCGGLLRTSWHEAADSVGVVPASALSIRSRLVAVQEQAVQLRCMFKRELVRFLRPLVIVDGGCSSCGRVG